MKNLAEALPQEEHRHAWEPIPSWGMRYRCSECKAIGYRGVVTDGLTAPLDAVEPYLCNKRVAGALCGSPAASVVRGGKNRCLEHLEERERTLILEFGHIPR